ncbi:unnamed protein product [Adineta steineri]|uniref:Uncharacterized protein n=1 Tax=Adineta steineri TaxID=433720 RepID=A0A814GW13_9BILA|nr:unnamed protein product [Adineta steineri]CAF3734306.1 unnamed protein product [Adineta steineri]
MIVQSAPLIVKDRNQPNRECLYAWYPEIAPHANTTTTIGPRDVYIYKGIDKDLLQQNSQTNGSINNNDSNLDVVQRYKQSMAPSQRAYHSPDTLDEALRTPWALHYEIERRPATPNFPSQSTDIPIREEIPRRLKSAPVVRSLPSTSVLTIPEPRFVTPMIPVHIVQTPQSPSVDKPRSRASSAKARLSTTVTRNNEQMNDVQQQRREIKSAPRIQQQIEIKSVNGDNQNSSTQVYVDTIINQPGLSIASTPPASPSPPVYVYQKSASWCGNEQQPLRTTAEINPTPVNPYYVRRSGVVSAKNVTKKAVLRENSFTKQSNRHRRRHYQHHHHHQDKRNQPLIATTPIPQSGKYPFEIDGTKLLYDPTLKLDDSSSNLKKYLIEGRLYLIKNQRYNVIETVEPIPTTITETNTQELTLPPRPKYYQTIPVEKFQIPKPAPEVHYNANETYFYNTMPKRVHRYVIDPNFISENLNINKMSLSKRPLTATVVPSSMNDINRQSTVYA